MSTPGSYGHVKEPGVQVLRRSRCRQSAPVVPKGDAGTTESTACALTPALRRIFRQNCRQQTRRYAERAPEQRTLLTMTPAYVLVWWHGLELVWVLQQGR